MIRSLKILGLMAVAALAMSAMLASAAQADPKGVFTTGEARSDTTAVSHTEATVTGHQYGDKTTNYFATTEKKGEEGEEIVTCGSATFDITEDDPEKNGTAETVTAEPTYTHCTASGLPATVQMNGCDYTFEQPTKIETNTYTGTAWLHCPEGSAVEVTVFLFGGVTSHSVDVCTIKVFPANGTTETLKGHNIYHNQINTNTGNIHDITVNATFKGLSWEEEGSCGEESGNEAVYRNTVTVTAFDEVLEDHDDVWISDAP